MRFDSELCAEERAFLKERDAVISRGIRAFLHPTPCLAIHSSGECFVSEGSLEWQL